MAQATVKQEDGKHSGAVFCRCNHITQVYIFSDVDELGPKRKADGDLNGHANGHEMKRLKTTSPQPDESTKPTGEDEDQSDGEPIEFKPVFPEKPAEIEERKGEISFQVVNNDGNPRSMIILTGLKCIFQKQLPKMPKDYIARLVYDRTHLSIAIVKKPPAGSAGTKRALRHIRRG